MAEPKFEAIFTKDGVLYLVDQKSSETVLSCGFAVHFAGWSLVQTKPTIPEKTDHLATSTAISSPTVWVHSKAVSSSNERINIQSRAGYGSDGSVLLEVLAYPTATINDISSARLQVTLPSKIWESGQMSLNTTVSLPAAGSSTKDYNLFKEVLDSTQTTPGFVGTTRGGTRVVVKFFEETGPASFLDIRQWTPSFEVRINPISGKWQEGVIKRWQISLSSHSITQPPIQSNTSSETQRQLSLVDTTQFELSPEQISQFRTKGFLLLRNIIPSPAVQLALKTFNVALEKSELTSKDVATSPAFSNLVNRTGVYTALCQLFGEDNAPTSVSWCQVAPVYPSFNKATPHRNLGYHIDGLPTPTNGVDPGHISPFSALVGIYLSSQVSEHAGNLVVFPGSHEHMAAFLRKHPNVTVKNANKDLFGPDGMFKFDLLPSLPMEPEPIMAEPGDVLLAHYLLAHTVASNTSPNIRYALYYRTSAESLAKHRELSVTDPWIDFHPRFKNHRSKNF